MHRKSLGTEVTWIRSYRESREPELMWTGSHVDRKSRGLEVTWTGSHVVRKSRGPEVTGTVSHVGRKLQEPEVTWIGSDRFCKSRVHVDRKSRGPEVTWTGIHVHRKSHGPEVTVTGIMWTIEGMWTILHVAQYSPLSHFCNKSPQMAHMTFDRPIL